MWPFKKREKRNQNQILSEEDIASLKKIERDAYIKEAEKLVVLRGQQKAKTELSINEDKNKWQM